MEAEKNRYCMSVSVGFHVSVRGGEEKLKETTCIFYVCVCVGMRESGMVCPASSGWLDKERLVGLTPSSILAHLVTH